MPVRPLIALLVCSAVAGCAGAPPPPVLDAHVTRVVDGDTVRVRVDGGAEEVVRYIGVDTPETARSPRGEQCFGAQATRANERLAAGERVRLQPDRERRDRYGRLLAYVSRVRDKLDIGAELLRGGYARTLVVAPNERRRAEYAGVARTASERGRGLWAACPADR